MRRSIFLIAMCFFFNIGLISCQDNQKSSADEPVTDIESEESDYRPNFHFTPETGWMNDPNGMFYLDGTYHLFFQHNPNDNVWGNMHWGHATSKDLVSWEEQPIALKPDKNGTIFSGSAVYDRNNTSGLGTESNPPVVAIFTYHDVEAERQGRKDFQTQAIAYSLDQGKTFKKYEGNPVLPNPGIRDFRDPKVVWYEEADKWIMSLAVEDHISFYSSPNLIDWEHESDFGQNLGGHGGVWECPDLFKMKVDGSNEEKWVLLVSINPGGPNGGSATQYFVGEFDGTTFTPDESIVNMGEEHNYWLDFGKDNYAGVTWANVPQSDGRTLFIGWMSNWEYANEVPTDPWRSTSTVARVLKLKKDGDQYRVFSQPVEELYDYAEETFEKQEIRVEGYTTVEISTETDLSQAIVKFEIPTLKDQIYEFYLTNVAGDTLKFGYNHSEKQFFINRKKSGLTDFNEKFAANISTAPRTSKSETLSAEIVLDKTSIELFFDDGETVMTEVFFPTEPFQKLSVNAEEGFTIEDFKIYQLKFN